MNFGNPLPDMLDMTDQELTKLAMVAFNVGLVDGRTLANPITATKLLDKLPGHPHRVGHKDKLRQIYGAGFDISKLNARVNATRKAA